VSRRHTAFAAESTENTFNGSVAPGKRIVATIQRVADLLGECWLEISLTKGSGTSFFAAEQLIQSATLEIGGTQVDRITNHVLRAYSELFRSSEEKAAYAAAVDFAESDAAGTVRTFYVPLCFSFCRAPANYLPVVALQFHEIRITIDLASAADLAKVGVDASSAAQFGVKLMTESIWLDAEERKRTAQSSSENLIQQVQIAEESIKIGTNKATTNVRLAINHPVFLQAWYVRDAEIPGKTFPGPLVHSTKVPTDEKLNPIAELNLSFNGHTRVARKGSYFGVQQPLQYFKTNPQSGIGCFSYALKPSDPTHPSGSVNCSRIDHIAAAVTTKKASAASANAILLVDEDTLSDAATQLQNFTFVSWNWNVLRITSGKSFFFFFFFGMKQYCLLRGMTHNTSLSFSVQEWAVSLSGTLLHQFLHPKKHRCYFNP